MILSSEYDSPVSQTSRGFGILQRRNAAIEFRAGADFYDSNRTMITLSILHSMNATK